MWQGEGARQGAVRSERSGERWAGDMETEANEGWQGTWDVTSSEIGCQGGVWLEVRAERGLAHSRSC